MADAEPLFALLEIMLRTFNKPTHNVKPGGHPDDMFLRLTDEEREELECSICYQVMKEVRQCSNSHKFCYSCIFVWSTSGNPVNHGRCPVCRTEGNYVRNKELDDKINRKVVKCATKGCRWIGILKQLQAHQHTNYSEPSEVNSNELPALTRNTTPSTARSRATDVSSSQTTLTPPPPQNASDNSSQRRSLTNVTNNATQNRSLTNNAQGRSVSQRLANSQSTSRTRARSRPRNNSTSPQRRITTSTTGLNTRLTSRARIQNGGEISNTTARQRDENGNGESVTQTSETVLTPRPPETVLTPRPPVTPRPQGGTTRRRMPTLPSLVNSINNNQSESSANTNPSLIATDSNNNVNETESVVENPLSFASSRRNPLEGSIGRRVTGTPRGFATVRDRLNESRQRLDMLMNAFSVELDRGRHDLSTFQQEREQRRQEQLAEVRDLGVRLGQVATELRGLLSQRRQIRHQIDHLVDSSGGEDTD